MVIRQMEFVKLYTACLWRFTGRLTHMSTEKTAVPKDQVTAHKGVALSRGDSFVKFRPQDKAAPA